MACVFLISGMPLPAHATPTFSEAGPLATDSGHLHVGWTSDEPVTLTIVDVASAKARPIYRGAGNGLFLSGLKNGEYRLELVGDSGERAEPVLVEVAHQSLDTALWLAGLGAVVFLLTVGAILRGAQDD